MSDKPNRRDALKALTAATGALSLAALPDEWTTPVINAGALPPHAQVSPACTNTFRVEMEWTAGGDADVAVYDPATTTGPQWVSYGKLDGDTASLQADITTEAGTEVITSPGTTGVPAVDGTYTVAVDARETARTLQVRITTDLGTTTIDVNAAVSTTHYVADITFPGCVVTQPGSDDRGDPFENTVPG